MLEVNDVHVHYGAIRALQGITLQAGPREIICLIGGNGAGKTTMLNALSGVHPASRGRILLEDREITRMSPPQIVSLGLVQVPEGRQVFPPLSVMENLEMGAYLRFKRENRQQILADVEMVCGLFPVLRDRKEQVAGTLSGGEQQMLAIARGLMARPRVLLLDEPSLGLAPMVIVEIFRVIRLLPERGTAALLVEQNARAALNVSHRGYVLEIGRVTLQGDSRELLGDERVKRAFLGQNSREPGQPPR